jgi:hypothetical protein
MDCNSLLKVVLAVNGSFSAASSALTAVYAVTLSRWLGLPTGALIALALGLAAFSAAVLWQATRREPDLSMVRAIFLLDVAWVIGSAVALAWPGLPIAAPARWIITAAGVVVGLFAAGEALGLSRSTAGVRLG